MTDFFDPNRLFLERRGTPFPEPLASETASSDQISTDEENLALQIPGSEFLEIVEEREKDDLI
jgi:hypothetical protein